MDKAQLDRAFRNGWILVLAAVVFVVVAFVYVFRMNESPPPRSWNMGGVPFVPASSTYGNGYYVPTEGQGEGEKR